jgi:hypothetical protein
VARARRRTAGSRPDHGLSAAITRTQLTPRALTIGHGHALSPALGALGWLAGLLLIFVPLAVRVAAGLACG